MLQQQTRPPKSQWLNTQKIYFLLMLRVPIQVSRRLCFTQSLRDPGSQKYYLLIVVSSGMHGLFGGCHKSKDEGIEHGHFQCLSTEVTLPTSVPILLARVGPMVLIGSFATSILTLAQAIPSTTTTSLFLNSSQFTISDTLKGLDGSSQMALVTYS